MKPIATITTTKQKNRKIEFHKARLLQFLIEVLGFRYTQIDGKGYYLRLNYDGFFEVVDILDIRHTFLNFIETNIEQIPLNGECSRDELFNAFIEQLPIKNGKLSREFLSENFQLDPHNLHLIRMKIDYKYKRIHTNLQMLKFLKDEGFSETIDKAGNFTSDKPLFYKRINENSFLVINRLY
jgi:hypothetical protein